MILPKKIDALHLAWMYRLLGAIADDAFVSSLLRFKGGTCAAMRGIINRFSVDLDFDLIDEKGKSELSKHLENIFKKLRLEIKDKSRLAPQYFLRYPKTDENPRNIIKIDVAFPPAKHDRYEPVRFSEIDRILHCHTIPTMFAHKLIALIGRWERTGTFASRDLFDIHTFFIKGYEYDENIIRELRGVEASVFLAELCDFINRHVTQTLIDEDLNVLLLPQEFQRVRKILKQETLMLLKNSMVNST
ncbi:nucleotidyl transferase AbiEii/AbiGii toxin family protein [Candidatus Peregrinibacteria bacterium]|nr:nucleotidyl transferase AbiEii/AbiGii toxin family protein [Candidatus Peregrinibacteria bacterium]